MVSALASSSLLERKVSPKALKALVKDWDLLQNSGQSRSKVRSSLGSLGQSSNLSEHWSKVLKVKELNPTDGDLPSCRDCNSELDQSQDSRSMQRRSGGTELNPAGREGCIPAHVRISTGCQTPFLQSLASTPDPANRVLQDYLKTMFVGAELELNSLGLWPSRS